MYGNQITEINTERAGYNLWLNLMDVVNFVILEMPISQPSFPVPKLCKLTLGEATQVFRLGRLQDCIR